MLRAFAPMLAIATLTACSSQEEPGTFSPQLMERARTIAQSSLIVDTHIDMPYRMKDEYIDVSVAAPDRNFDYPRAREGGLDAPFMSIYVPAEKEQDGTAVALANELIDMVEREISKAADKFVLATSSADIESQFGNGRISFALGLENGAPIAGDLANLRHFYDRGIRYITLTHSKTNHISDSSYDEERQWDGLSPFGEKLIGAMNNIGMMVDISHVSDEAFYDVLRVAKAPPIASHSSARHFTPDWERNMDDDMIVALAKSGGVVQINFGSTFVNQKSRQNQDQMSRARDIYLDEHDYEKGGEEAEAWTNQYREKIPLYFADVSDVLDHIDHVRDLAGIDYVGLGSDFDGVGDSLPTGLKDVSTYPVLIAGMLDRGYSEEDIRKVLGGNIMRVWRAVEAYARNPM